MGYISSGNIKVFPCGGRNKLFDPLARLTTEYNLVSMINRLVDKESFIVTTHAKDFQINTESADPYLINIGGYLFTTLINHIFDALENETSLGEEDYHHYINASIMVNSYVDSDYQQLGPLEPLEPAGLSSTTLPVNSYTPGILDQAIDDENNDGTIDENDSKFVGIRFYYARDKIQSKNTLTLFERRSLEDEHWYECEASKIKFITQSNGLTRSVAIDDGDLDNRTAGRTAPLARLAAPTITGIGIPEDPTDIGKKFLVQWSSVANAASYTLRYSVIEGEEALNLDSVSSLTTSYEIELEQKITSTSMNVKIAVLVQANHATNRALNSPWSLMDVYTYNSSSNLQLELLLPTYEEGEIEDFENLPAPDNGKVYVNIADHVTNANTLIPINVVLSGKNASDVTVSSQLASNEYNMRVLAGSQFLTLGQNEELGRYIDLKDTGYAELHIDYKKDASIFQDYNINFDYVGGVRIVDAENNTVERLQYSEAGPSSYDIMILITGTELIMPSIVQNDFRITYRGSEDAPSGVNIRTNGLVEYKSPSSLSKYVILHFPLTIAANSNPGVFEVEFTHKKYDDRSCSITFLPATETPQQGDVYGIN